MREAREYGWRAKLATHILGIFSQTAQDLLIKNPFDVYVIGGTL
jgi:hypothetical protein